MENNHNLIITITNEGCSKQVMDAARAAGATGGTVIKGLGTGSQIEKLVGLNIKSEKEVVLIVSTLEDTAKIIEAIKKEAGKNSSAQGITFSLPVGDFSMLSSMMNGGDNSEDNN